MTQRLHSSAEFKFDSGGDAGTFDGYAAVFGNVDSYGDMIMPGAFADTIAAAKTNSARWPAMLLQHGGAAGTADDMTPIGVWVDFREDARGLYAQGKLADTQRGRDALTLLRMTPRPAITGLSIGYVAKEWEMRSRPDEPRRKLKKIDLLETSLVTFPANNDARVLNVKAMSDSEIERLLREAGLSRGEAKALCAGGLKALKTQREAGESGGMVDAARRLLDTLKG